MAAVIFGTFRFLPSINRQIYSTSSYLRCGCGFQWKIKSFMTVRHVSSGLKTNTDNSSEKSLHETVQENIQQLRDKDFNNISDPNEVQHFRVRKPPGPSECKEYPSKAMDQIVKENLQQIRDQDFSKIQDPTVLVHFRSKKATERSSEASPTEHQEEGEPPIGTITLPHRIWTEEEVGNIQITHMEPQNFIDRLAHRSVKVLRFGFDVLSGYKRKKRDESVWLTRIIFLETVAGVPGMVAAMTRHLHSLRRMRRDHGWIHTLLEEAENERMHLMTAIHLKQPTWLFRAGVLITQGIFVNAWAIAYLLSPHFCHRFVGYLEEEAVVTYTKCLNDIENGPMQHWKTQDAPPVAKRYWQLPEDSTMKDVILAIRADEAHHRVVNHTFGSMKADDYNPYKPGE